VQAAQGESRASCLKAAVAFERPPGDVGAQLAKLPLVLITNAQNWPFRRVHGLRGARLVQPCGAVCTTRAAQIVQRHQLKNQLKSSPASPSC